MTDGIDFRRMHEFALEASARFQRTGDPAAADALAARYARVIRNPWDAASRYPLAWEVCSGSRHVEILRRLIA
ncbi:hypothetical protein [Catellatospora sp. IY07-71]|uniref:hypothetical protein n=1 Tax=Catellatospora sp. IY07-71 TaxID=2728827 RepID=UPI001BB37033|nr:hypothetical protein [Catellatospora sp. IY07-71]